MPILNIIKMYLHVPIFLSVILLGYYITNQLKSSINDIQLKNRLRDSWRKHHTKVNDSYFNMKIALEPGTKILNINYLCYFKTRF